jgi:phosphonate C-P lyase system protein PhnG
MSETIGFIGVGLMGHGMAKNIVEKGYALTVMGHRNRTPVEDLLTRGAKEAKSPKALAEASSIVFLCVTGSRQVGVGYVLGCSHRQALLVALADALLQESDLHARWYELLIAPLIQMQTQATQQQQAQTQSTRVEFFTVAREAGTDRGEEDAP